jgi:hypothetical protein
VVGERAQQRSKSVKAGDDVEVEEKGELTLSALTRRVCAYADLCASELRERMWVGRWRRWDRRGR